MRFLHLADLHLDTPLLGRTPDVRGVLRDGLGTAFRSAVAYAVRERLDALLIAGDLFDGERLSYGTERLLLAGLEELGTAGIPVFYATGNHDPGGPAGLASRVAWPENVTLFEGPEPLRVAVRRGEEVVGWVTGAGHDSTRVATDLSRGFPRPEGKLPEVALLHTQVTGAKGEEGHDRYAPSELRRLQASGYHYWAIGHIHLREALSGAPPIHYPGNLQGRSPRERGAKGGLLVDLAEPEAPTVRFLEFAPVRWEEIRLAALDEVTTLLGLGSRVRAAWEEARAGDPGLPGGSWLVRVILDGVTPLAPLLRTEGELRALEAELAAELGVLDLELRVGGVRPPIQVEEHQERPDVLGEALRLARDLLEGGDPGTLGLSAEDLAGWEGSDLSLDGYLRELLADAPESIVERMVRRQG